MERRPGGSGRGPGPTTAASIGPGRWDHPPSGPPSLAGLWPGLSRGARSKIATVCGLLLVLLLLEAVFSGVSPHLKSASAESTIGSAAANPVTKSSTPAASAETTAARGQGLTLPSNLPRAADAGGESADRADVKLDAELKGKAAGKAVEPQAVPDGYFPIKHTAPPTLAGGRGPPGRDARAAALQREWELGRAKDAAAAAAAADANADTDAAVSGQKAADSDSDADDAATGQATEPKADGGNGAGAGESSQAARRRLLAAEPATDSDARPDVGAGSQPGTAARAEPGGSNDGPVSESKAGYVAGEVLETPLDATGGAEVRPAPRDARARCVNKNRSVPYDG